MAKSIAPILVGAAALFLLGGKKDESTTDKPSGDPDEGESGAGAGQPREGTPVTKVVRATLAAQPTTGSSPVPQSPSGTQVPTTAHCAAVANWDPAWVAMEEDILQKVNQIRAAGYTCASGYWPPVPPLSMNEELRCSARLHSKDMADRNYFSHTNPEGLNSWDRMRDAGYDYSHATENIAAGFDDLDRTMEQWLTSQAGHCKGIMDPEATEIGIGYFPKPGSQYRHYWTQNFAAPA